MRKLCSLGVWIHAARRQGRFRMKTKPGRRESTRLDQQKQPHTRAKNTLEVSARPRREVNRSRSKTSRPIDPLFWVGGKLTPVKKAKPPCVQCVWHRPAARSVAKVARALMLASPKEKTATVRARRDSKRPPQAPHARATELGCGG